VVSLDKYYYFDNYLYKENTKYFPLIIYRDINNYYIEIEKQYFPRKRDN
jgi:hypothetical protein